MKDQSFHGDKSLRTCKKKSRVEELIKPNLPLGYLKVETIGNKTIKFKIIKDADKIASYQFFCEVQGSNAGVQEVHMVSNGTLLPKIYRPIKILSSPVIAKYKEFDSYYEYYLTHTGTYLLLRFRTLSHTTYIPEHIVIADSDIPSDAISVVIE
nr:MAG TPA: hypothetical protein [Siphoviridae sp. ctIyp7]